MTDLPKVISPLASVGESEGVELILVSVEAWPDEIVVRLRGRPSPLTRRLETEFGEALEAWHREGRDGHPPVQPAEHVLGFDLRLSDDVGTAYALRSSARGGSGTMFRAEWTFVPGPPDRARRLAIRVDNRPEMRIDLGRA